MTPADLKTHLATLAMTQDEFAAHVGRHPRSVLRWLNGEVPVPTLVAREVVALLSAKIGRAGR